MTKEVLYLMHTSEGLRRLPEAEASRAYLEGANIVGYADDNGTARLVTPNEELAITRGVYRQLAADLLHQGHP